MELRSPRRRLASLAAPLALAALALLLPAAAAAEVSSNWAGYAVGATPSSGSFHSVAATWVVAAGSCHRGRETDSSTWIGLGGYTDQSNALEQTGTDFDCSSAGRASYSAWYELWPADSVDVPLKVHAGDTMSAAVAVHGTAVVFDLRDVTAGASFHRAAHMKAPDVSYAEWIVEAPTVCDSNDSCTQPALSDFGTLTFTSASVTTAGGHTGAIADAAWSPTSIMLDEPRSTRRRLRSAAFAPGATPSALSADGASFAVSYRSLRRDPAPRSIPGHRRPPRR